MDNWQTKRKSILKLCGVILLIVLAGLLIKLNRLQDELLALRNLVTQTDKCHITESISHNPYRGFHCYLQNPDQQSTLHTLL